AAAQHEADAARRDIADGGGPGRLLIVECSGGGGRRRHPPGPAVKNPAPLFRPFFWAEQKRVGPETPPEGAKKGNLATLAHGRLLSKPNGKCPESRAVQGAAPGSARLNSSCTCTRSPGEISKNAASPLTLPSISR